MNRLGNLTGKTYRWPSISAGGGIRCQNDGRPLVSQLVTQRASPLSLITFSVRVIAALANSELWNAKDPLRSMRERISSRDAGDSASISAIRQARLSAANSCCERLGRPSRTRPILDLCDDLCDELVLQASDSSLVRSVVGGNGVSSAAAGSAVSGWLAARSRNPWTTR